MILNGGAALYVAGLVESLKAGVARARELLADDSTQRTLEALRAVSQSVADET